MNKRAQLNMGLLWGVIGLASVIVVAGLFLAFGADIVDDINADFTANSYADNATTNTLEAMDTLSERQDTIAQIGIVVIIIGLLMGVVAFVGMRR